MRYLVILSISATLIQFIQLQATFGHGFELSLDGNQILAESEVPTASPHMFVEQLDPFNSTTLFTDHGSVEAGSGFHLPSDTLSVEFLGPLWFSDGSVAHHAPSTLNLVATSYDSGGDVLGSVNVTGSSQSPGSFSVVGDDDHSIGWVLSGSSIAPGAYGFAYRVLGLRGGDPTTPFDPSAPLVVVYNTPGFAGTSLSDAQQSIFQSIMQGDFNLDGKRTGDDIPAMLAALVDLEGYQTAHDLNDFELAAIADVDRSGDVNNADIQALLDLLIEPSPAHAVPEPPGLCLILTAVSLLAASQWRTVRLLG